MKYTFAVLFAFLSVTFFAQVDLVSNLVICMPMNGNANDYSGNNNNGLISGATPTVNRFGVANSAYHFDGINDFISVQPSASIDSIEANDEVTITGWCRVNNWYQGWNIFSILEKYDTNTDAGWGFSLMSPYTNWGFNDIMFFANGTGPGYTEYNAAVVFNQWDFYAVSFSKSAQQCKLYKNGVLLYTNPTYGASLLNTNSVINIGFSPAGPDEYNDGDIDEIRLYNRALNALEITALYNSQSECNLGAGPVANFISSANQVCANQSLTLTDQSTGNPTTWNWQLPGGNPSASSSSVPVVSYSVAGIYTVSLVTSNTLGISYAAVQTITVSALPVPLIGFINPVCPSASLQLSASGATSYSWSGPANFSTTIQNPVIPSVSLSNAGIYTITGTNASGCQSSTVITINVLISPTVSAAGASACFGKSAILNSNGGVAYQWAGPANYISSSQNPTLTTVTNFLPDSYTVTVTGANTCSASAVVTVVALPNPTLLAGDVSVCYGESAVLTASGASTYAWAGPFGYNSGAAFTIPSVTNLSAGVYTVNGTAINSCSTTMLVNLSAIPLPTVLAVSFTVCSGQSASLTAIGATAYNWAGPGGFTANGQTVFFPTVTNVQPQTYTVTGTAANTCTLAVTATLATFPNPVIQAIGTTVCYGSPANLSASGANTYTWTGPSTTNVGPGLFIPVADNLSSGIYTVTGMLSANSCTSSVTVPLSTMPLPTVTASSATVCERQVAPLTASGGVSYAWSGPFAFSANTPSILINTVTPGLSIYTVVATGANSCTNVAFSTIFVNPLPSVSLTATGTLICAGQSTTLSANGAAFYSWSPTPGNSSMLTVAPLATTVYSVTGVDENNCGGIATITVSVDKCVGLEELRDNKVEFTVYPNPSSGVINIKAADAVQLKLVNALGQLICDIDLNEMNYFETTIGNLSEGIYYLVRGGWGAVTAQKISIDNR